MEPPRRVERLNPPGRVDAMTDLLSSLSGVLVGLILGFVGGGGSVLAVPLLVYGVGVGSAHVVSVQPPQKSLLIVIRWLIFNAGHRS